MTTKKDSHLGRRSGRQLVKATDNVVTKQMRCRFFLDGESENEHNKDYFFLLTGIISER